MFPSTHLLLSRPGLLLLALLAAGPVVAQSPESTSGETASLSAFTGTVAGVVVDRDSGQALSGVTVEIFGTDLTTVTDLNGRYQMPEVPEGLRSLVLSKEGYLPTEVTDILVRPGELYRVDVPLPRGEAKRDLDVIELGTYTVAAEVLEESDVGLLSLRQEAVAISDGISAEAMGRLAISDVADAVTRLPGITIAESKFAVIRGLGDRYSNTQLNGVVQPSSDPDRQAVQLDLFPSKLLDTVSTQKAFTPDQPGDSSGGAINVKPKSFPEARLVGLGFGFQVNDRAWSSDYPEYVGSRWDAVAKGSRGRSGPMDFDNQVPFSLRTGEAPVSLKLSANYGETFNLFDRPLGLVLGFNRDASSKLLEGFEQKRLARLGALADGKMDLVENSYRFVQAVEEVSLAGLAGLSYQFSPEHELAATVFLTQVGIDTGKYQYDGDIPAARSDDDVFIRHNLYYRERNLTAYQLRGGHLFPSLGELGVDWILNRSETYQKEPDFRQTLIAYIPNADYYTLNSLNNRQNADRFWRDIDETQDNFQIDLTLPLGFWDLPEANLRAGAAILAGERQFTEVRRRLNNSIDVILEDPALVDEEIRQQEAIFGKGLFVLSDTNEASFTRDIQAGYLMGTVPLWDLFKLTAGFRSEKTEISVDAPNNSFGNLTFAQFINNTTIRDLLGITDPSPSSKLDQDDLLPAIHLTWELRRDMNVRASWSKTVARPSYREMGPYFIDDVESGDLMFGNPQLQMSDIENYDLRWEWFRERSDLVAVSFFYKEIDRPIEQVFARLSGSAISRSWFNNPNTATLYGVELEARQSLGFLADWLSGVSLGGNFSWIEAEVDLAEAERKLKALGYGSLDLVPTSRRLFDQPEWLLNLDLTWDIASWGSSFTFAVNGSSEVLTGVGSEFTFDVFRQSRYRGDFVYSQKIGERWALKLAVKNLTDEQAEWLYDPERTATTIVRRNYWEGRSISLSASAEF